MWESLEPRLRALVERPLDAAGVPQFLLDVDAIEREVGEAYAGLTRARDENTADEAAKAAYLAFVTHVLPRLEPIGDVLNRKLLGVPDYRPPAALAPAWANLRDQVDLYREANVPLHAEEATLGQRYGEIVGRTRVVIDGAEITVATATAKLDEPDRGLRERAYRAIDAAREEHRGDLDDLFLLLARLRERLAHNAGVPDYRAFAWRAMHRHEYTPEDALELHEAVAQELVPRLRTQRERRRVRMGLSALRPWDLHVDPDGRPPLAPFGSVAELEAGLSRMFHALDPELGDDFELLRDGWMDLEPRPNKVPGMGYQNYFPVARRPYVYWSAVGTDNDLLTMRHEAGHAFHSIATERAWPLLKHAADRPEVNELAAQGLELLTLPHLARERGGFYDPADAARSQAMLLDRVFDLLVSVCQVDAIQHWVYTRPAAELTVEGIDGAWRALQDRFDTGIDWTGLERARAKGWQVIHVFQYPFYYLEYALAYLGALQLWERALADPPEALAGYKRMLALGGTRPIDELYAAAGIEFRFDRATVARLADLVVAKLAENEG